MDDKAPTKKDLWLVAVLAALLLAVMLVQHTPAKAQQPLLKYNAQGRLVASSHEVYDDKDRLAVVVTYTYNDSTGAVETRMLTGYDPEGRISRTEIYSPDDILLFSDDYTYDRKGRLKRRVQKSFDENGTLIDKTTLP